MIRYLVFYLSMARNMVDGKLSLFYGIIALDLGMFAYTLQDIPPIYIVLYLLITHLFSALSTCSGRWRPGGWAAAGS